MQTATREQMQAIEQRAIAGGLSAGRLMENAGAAAAHAIRAAMPPSAGVVLLCGRGNNGGDGFVIARYLTTAGFPVTVVLPEGMPQSSTAREKFDEMGDIPVILPEAEPYRAAAAVSGAAVVVDAVYGIGFHGELPDGVLKIFALVRREQRRFAVDIPSGLCCDSGRAAQGAFAADCTLTFTAMKPALVMPSCAELCGEVRLLDIGIDKEDVCAVLSDAMLHEGDIAPCFPPRAADSHKGTYGHLLAFCGSYGMAGAAILSARAALRCGVGLLTLALPRSVYPIVSAAVPEAVCLPLPETEEGQLAPEALSLLLSALPGKDALLVGCGIGTAAQTVRLVCALLPHAACPVVLDADGLNAVAAHIDVLETVKAPLIFTPHPGEMARLTGHSVAQVQAQRAQLAAAFAGRYENATVVLKGHHTVIADAAAQYVNPTGNPGMATGGSGDVLAGMIAAFAAAGMRAADAAKCGVYLHGRAGDLAAAKHSQHAMLPSDIIEELSAVFLHFEKQGDLTCENGY